MFNPSIQTWNDKIVVAVRTSESPVGPVKAAAFVVDRTSMSIDESASIDLTSLGRSFGISNVADPKLFTYRGDIWLTFNTGYVGSGNDVYVMSIHPTIGVPIRCELPERQVVEKNWAFFEGANDRLAAIYSLDPLKLLSFEEREDASGLPYYKAHIDYAAANPACANLTIGTQPLAVDGALMLIAHKRIGHPKFRGYLGRPVRVHESDGKWSSELHRTTLIHSFRTLLGSRHKRNKHLWFATYFSGLALIDDEIVASYGINDQAAGLAQLSTKMFTR